MRFCRSKEACWHKVIVIGIVSGDVEAGEIVSTRIACSFACVGKVFYSNL